MERSKDNLQCQVRTMHSYSTTQSILLLLIGDTFKLSFWMCGTLCSIFNRWQMGDIFLFLLLFSFSPGTFNNSIPTDIPFPSPFFITDILYGIPSLPRPPNTTTKDFGGLFPKIIKMKKRIRSGNKIAGKGRGEQCNKAKKKTAVNKIVVFLFIKCDENSP